jgi:hypothetical protein
LTQVILATADTGFLGKGGSLAGNDFHRATIPRPYPKYLDWLRYLCAYLLFTYGLSKLSGVQFTIAPEIARRPIGSLSGYQLTWFYYSYSRVYADILGLTQLVGGALLLFRKTALLGAAIMTPVMANILMINLFFQIAVGAECMAAFIFASMLTILWRERGGLVALFWTQQEREPASSLRLHWSLAALVILVAVAQIVVALLLSRR